jgi:hypothetical protein
MAITDPAMPEILRRILWFVAFWALGVACVAALAYVIRAMIL